MKRTISASVFAALGMAAAAASAQTNVSIYGIVDLGLVHESGAPAPGSTLKLTSGIANGSRVGFRGTEDLGGGLSAIFTIENGFQADTGALGQGGLMFGRQAFVGLNGGFGSVKLGRQYSAIDTLFGAVDPFGNGLTGKTVNLLARGYVSRVNNSVQYATPVFGGFSADVMMGFGEVAGNSSASRFIGGSFGYAAGPLYVRAAYQDTNNATDTGSDRNAAIGANYNFGIAAAHGLYAKSKLDAAGVTTGDFDDYMLAVSAPIGAGKVLLSYTHRDDNLAANRDANMVGLAYLHFLSKRTTLYTSYGRISNKNGAAYTVGSAIDAGTGNKGLAAGIRHTF